jgi:predicted nucleic acid-binding protein
VVQAQPLELLLPGVAKAVVVGRGLGVLAKQAIGVDGGAGARSRHGASYQLLSMLPSRDFEIALTVPLYTEWQAVLTRPEHLPPGVTVDATLGFLRYLASVAHLQDVHFLWRPFLRDPDDDMVLECAVASGSLLIVTHSLKNFKQAPELGVQAIKPVDFLKLLKEKS